VVLTLEQINTVPKGMSHSIYEEFWHLVTWQDIAGSKDEGNYSEWEKGERFPKEKATNINQWEELVKNFNDRVGKILDYCSNGENLKIEAEPGLTIGDALDCLAVHNAVHFGKILAIRQAIGAWPPKDK